jgi:Glycosyl hydrolases family 43
MKRFLFLLLMITSTLTTFANSAFAADGGFLFVTFRGEESPASEQIYFGLSQDGRHWRALNEGKPVLVSTLGEKGARDPYLLRAENGKFYLLATDLSIHFNRDWERAVKSGSRSLLIWESSDLVHWSPPRLVSVAPPDAGCTWAPEAIYDPASQQYLVYWASTTKRDNYEKQRIWAAWTKDFRAFSEPFIYIEKPTTVIDTDIVRGEDGRYYRFTKDEKFKAITMEVSDNLMGPWNDVAGFSLASLVGYEGPQCFLLEPAAPDKPPTWCLLLDYYSKRAGYQPFLNHDLASGQFTPASDFSFPFRFRHGSVLPVTAAEYERLQTRYVKSSGTQSD